MGKYTTYNRRFLVIIFITFISTFFIASSVIKNSLESEEIVLRNNVSKHVSSYNENISSMIVLVFNSSEHYFKNKNNFKKVYFELYKNQYTKNNVTQLISWIHESNPNYSVDETYDTIWDITNLIMDSKFDYEYILHYNKEHTTLLNSVTGSLFLSNKKPIFKTKTDGGE